MGAGFLSGYPEQGMVSLSPLLTPVEILRHESQTPRGPAILVRGDVRKGNSGGPLLETAGSAVGVVLAEVAPLGTYKVTGRAQADGGCSLPGAADTRVSDASGVSYHASAAGRGE